LLNIHVGVHAVDEFRTILLNVLKGATMKLRLSVIGPAMLVAMSSTAFAAQGLTPQQCHDYPFVQPAGEVTHSQLMQELSELEAVGYRPVVDNPSYPGRIQWAERKLRAEYRQDCMPAANKPGSTIG
jgi:Domain of unknown function (DUF4148)